MAVMRSGGRPRAETVEELQGHDLGVPRDPRGANRVVADRRNRAGHMRAVAFVVKRIGVVVGGVDAVHVVDISVRVVVDPVAGDFARIPPHVGLQIGMRVIHPRVNHGDDDVGRTREGFPGLRRINVGIARTPGLSGVVQAPHLAEVRIVGVPLLGAQDIVRLSVLHAVGQRPVCGPLLHVDTGRQLHDGGVDEAKAPGNRGAAGRKNSWR